MNHKSYTTQRLLNRLPPWTTARKYQHSLAQQLLNPVGNELEHLHGKSTDAKRNRYLTTANLDALDVSYVVRLPSTFDFGTDQSNTGNPLYLPPTITGTLADGTEVDVEAVESLEEFHAAATPTRVEDLGESVSLSLILIATQIQSLAAGVLNTIPVSSRLYVTVSGGTQFTDTSRNSPYAFLLFTGKTARGLDEVERIIIPYNGVFRTRKIWSELTSVQYFGIAPATTTIEIAALGFNMATETDPYRLFVEPATEKLLYHGLGTQTYGSTHKYMTMIANTLSDLYGGIDTQQIVREMELGYISDAFANITLNDIALQPFTNRLLGIDDYSLYVFDSDESVSDNRGLGQKTSGAMMIISADSYNYVRDESATFRPFWRRPIKRIYRNRWTLTTPSGTKRHIAIGASTAAVVLGDTGWIYNRTYTELVFGPFDATDGTVVSKQEFTIQLTKKGTYLLTLEVDYADGTKEKDIVPLHVHSKTAEAVLTLPTGLQNLDGIAFDADQYLWFLEEGGAVDTIYKARLATDTAIIDWRNKIIYLHEDYASVKIMPTEDFIP